MEAKGRELSPARIDFHDYVGIVAADDAEAVLEVPTLNELEKIDRDRYTMVGIAKTASTPLVTKFKGSSLFSVSFAIAC